MKIAYVTPYYNGVRDGRFGRFHDWVHTARDMDDPPFDFDVYAFTASNVDETIASDPYSYLGEASELWGTKLNKPEFLLNSPRIRSDLAEGDYDLINVLVMDTIVLPTVLSTFPDVPVVIGPDIAGWSPIRRGMFDQETTREIFKNRIKYTMKNVFGRIVSYDRIIAFSEYHREILQTFSISETDIEVIHGGVHNCFTAESSDPNPNEPPEILYVGDFSDHKGYPLFLKALAQLDEPFHARIVGAGDPHREQIDELGLRETVTVEGFVPREDLPKYYQRADLHVVASIDETAGPNTQLEALASGTPVVLTDAPSVNEYAPDNAAVYFWPRDPQSLRNALERALDNLDVLTENAIKAAPEYLAENTLEDLRGIYESVIREE